jgi:DNA-directed RNA polymerase specialized sigma24 family protein
MATRREDLGMETFEVFVARVETPLRTALVATFGPQIGSLAANDAVSWAWEHWEKVRTLENPIGYLYRVGRTSERRSRGRLISGGVFDFQFDEIPDFNPDLVPALRRLSRQQCTAVVLVHAFGWTVRDTALTLAIAPSSVQKHLERGLAKLRSALDSPTNSPQSPVRHPNRPVTPGGHHG